MATLVTQDFGSIDYVECYDAPRSPAEMFGIRQSTVQRTFLVAWEDRLKFAAALLGYPQIATYMGGATYVQRVLPDRYSVLEELNPTAHIGESLYATRVMRGEGVGAESTSYGASDGGPVSRYTKCKLEVEYSHLPYEVLADDSIVSDNLSAPDEAQLLRYVEKQVNPGADYQRLPPHGFKHIQADGSEGEVVPGTPGKLTPNSDLALTWHQVPEEGVGLPLLNASKNAITAALGRVNKYTFANCEPGTLLLTAASIRRYRHFFGYWLCNVDYRFKFVDAGEARDGERAGHNYAFAAWPSLMDGVGHYEVSADGNNITIVAGPSSWGGNVNSLGDPSKNVYDWADFATLFRPGGEGVE